MENSVQMNQRYGKDRLKFYKKRKENLAEWRKKKSHIQVAAVQNEEMEPIGTESIAVSTKRSSRDFETNDMKTPRIAKRFFRCVKMEINKNEDNDNKMNNIDTLDTKIQKSKVLMRKRLHAKSLLTVASEVESEKPDGIWYNKWKVVKRSKPESAAGTHATIPYIKNGELKLAAGRTTGIMEEENNECITSCDLNANTPPVEKGTGKSTMSRSACEVKTKNTNSLEDGKRSHSAPNEHAIQITEVWSLDKETKFDEPATLEQQNKFLKIENAEAFSKYGTPSEPLDSDSGTDTASEAEFEDVETVFSKCVSSENKELSESVILSETKTGSSEVWSLKEEIESDKLATLEQQNEFWRTENAAKHVTMVKPLHSDKVTASKAEFEAVKAVLRSWTSSEKKAVIKSETVTLPVKKSGSCKSLDQVNSRFKKNKMTTISGRDQVYNSVPAYLGTFPNIQTCYPVYINTPPNIQSNPACTNMLPTLQVLCPPYPNMFPTVQMGYPAYPNTSPNIQTGHPAYLNSHPGRPYILQGFGGIPASNFPI